MKNKGLLKKVMAWICLLAVTITGIPSTGVLAESVDSTGEPATKAESQEVKTKEPVGKISLKVLGGKGVVRLSEEGKDAVDLSYDLTKDKDYEYTTAEGIIVNTELVPEIGYEVSTYRVLLDGGENWVEDEIPVKSLNYKKDLEVRGTVKVEVSFKAIEQVINPKEEVNTEVKEEVKPEVKAEINEEVSYPEGTYPWHDTSKEAIAFRASLLDKHNIDAKYRSETNTLTREYLDTYSEAKIKAVLGKDTVYLKGTIYKTNSELFRDGILKRQRSRAAHPSYTILARHDYNNPAGGRASRFTLDDGSVGTCVDHGLVEPPVGHGLTYIGDVGGNSRKAFWYGVGGPGDLGAYWSQWEATGNSADFVSILTISKAFEAEYQGNHGPTGAAVSQSFAYIQTLPDPPSSFKVYMLSTGNASFQRIGFWEYNPNGKIGVQKTSSRPNISNSNSNYSLAGAIYDIYKTSDNACVWNLVTDANGYAITGEIPRGEYYIRERTAPKGYNLDTSAHNISLNSDVVTASVTDIPKTGKIAVQKESSQPEITNGNDCYSLEGAKFDLYLQANGQKVATATTDKNGYAEFGDLPFQTYFVRESYAPKGYKLLEKDIRDIVLAENTPNLTYPITVKEEPANDPLGIRIGKIDKETNAANPPNGSMELKGAQYTVKYYGTLGSLAGKEPMRTWVLETNVRGFASLFPEYKVSGDEFFYCMLDGKPNGNPVIPVGTITVQETKAPKGYLLEGKLHTIKVESEDGIGLIKEWKQPISPESAVRGNVEIVKYGETMGESEDSGSDHKRPLKDVKFHFKSKTGGKSYTIITDKNGYASTKNLSEFEGGGLLYDTYTVTEESPYADLDEIAPFDITISEHSQTLHYILRNDTVNSPISVVKKDLSTGKTVPVAGTTFQLLDKDQKVIKMVVSRYPELVEKTEWKTNETGSFMLPEKLESGTYYLKELESPSGMLLNGSLKQFRVQSEGQWDSPITVEFFDENAMGQITVNKADENTGVPLEGAVFSVTAKKDIVTPDGTVRAIKGAVVDTLTTTVDGTAQSKKLFLGDYVVQEVNSPQYYAIKADKIDVTLKYKDQNTAVVYETVHATDKKTEYKLSKYDALYEKDMPLANVDFRLWEKGNEATSVTYTTNVNGELTFTNLKHGTTYHYQESKPNDGYVHNAKVYEFVVDKDGLIGKKDSDSNVIYNIINRIDVSKKALTGSDELPGARLAILNADGTTFTEWVSTDKTHRVEGLPAGDYTLVELEAPEGYCIAKPVPFTIVNDKVIGKVEMRNKKVIVTKLDVTGDVEQVGADLRVVDKEGAVVDKWVSEVAPHAIVGLRVGETYTLQETLAVEGYAIATDIKFTVRDDFSIQAVVMKDKQVKVSKWDITNDKELSGAELTVFDKVTGEVVDQWVSSDKPHAVVGLVVGKTYTLRETLTPESYATAKDMEFVVLDDFKVQSVVMKDKQVFVTKTDITGKEELIGANLVVTDKDGNIKDEWVSTKDKHPIKNLVVGEEYTLTETLAPEGYVIATSIKFTVEDDGKVQMVQMKDKQLFVSKTDMTGETELVGAELEVRNTKTGKILDTWVSSEKPHAVKNLEVNTGYTLKEWSAPEGFVIVNEIAFFVEDDFKVQTVTMKDSQVVVSKVDSDGRLVADAELEVVSKKTKNIVDKWVSTDKKHPISGLEVGSSYILRETKAPKGYVQASEIAFTVDTDTTNIELTMVDKQVIVSKMDVIGEKPVEGATMQVIELVPKTVGDASTPNSDSASDDLIMPISAKVDVGVIDGNLVDPDFGVVKKDEPLELQKYDEVVIEEWVTTKEAHKVTGLVVGKEYVLREKEAPKGWVADVDQKFTVMDDGLPQDLMIRDSVIQVEKVDLETGGGLIGAVLEVIDKETKDVVYTWKTDGKKRALSNLRVGKDYILHEKSAPDGVLLAKDIEFTANNDKNVLIKMEDDYTKVGITKRTEKGSGLSGALLQLVNAEGKVVKKWTSTGSEELITKLKPGKYVLNEIAPPIGYKVAKNITFEVKGIGEKQTVVMTDEARPITTLVQTNEPLIYVFGGTACLLFALYLGIRSYKKYKIK